MNVRTTKDRILRAKVINDCNLNCFFCHREGSAVSMPMTIEQIHTLTDFACQYGYSKFHITGGEPTLHRDLPEMVGLVRSHDLACSLTTNGQFNSRILTSLSATGLDNVNFSFHTLRSTEWAKIQGHEDRSLSQRQIDRLIHNIAESSRLGIFTKVNTVVGDDPELALEVINQLSEFDVDIRLLNILGSDRSLQNIDVVLESIQANRRETIESLGSSETRKVYDTKMGKITVKLIGNQRLTTMCTGCNLPCLEGFYNTRVESIDGELYVRLCLHRTDSMSHFRLSEFCKSKQLEEIMSLGEGVNYVDKSC
ncbi:MAG: radical SAM protein [Patescibacteria group bacterium]|jgi:cyclic pyranopterin phosphate synthase